MRNLLQMLQMMVNLNMFPFDLKLSSVEVEEELRRYITEVEPLVETEIKNTEIVHKVSRIDLRLLIFNGIITRKQGLDNYAEFKQVFMDNAEWLLKTNQLNRVIQGLFQDHCLNFRLTWEKMFGGEEEFVANFGEERQHDETMRPFKVKDIFGGYMTIKELEEQKKEADAVFDDDEDLDLLEGLNFQF